LGARAKRAENPVPGSCGALEGCVIDTSSGESLYSQVERILRDLIRKARIRPREDLPTEKVIMQILGVSRVTVRKAMENLVRDGLVVRVRGRGTAVSPPKLEVDLRTKGSFTVKMTSEGHKVDTHIRRQIRVNVSEEVAQALKVDPSSSVTLLERVIHVDQECIVFFQTHLHPRVQLDGKKIKASLYTFLEEQGLKVAATEDYLEAVAADTHVATLLQVPTGTPLLRRVRCGQLLDGTPIEYTIGHYRGDRYRYRFSQKDHAIN